MKTYVCKEAEKKNRVSLALLAAKVSQVAGYEPDPPRLISSRDLRVLWYPISPVYQHGM